jgi:hypothetical protein
MIDGSTGAFRTDDGLVLGPATTEQAFLASPIGCKSKDIGHNDGWSRYDLPRALRALSVEWDGIVYFFNGTMKKISLSIYDPSVRGWEDWSESKELLAKQKHDDILTTILGSPPYLYSWGEVFSTYDARSGTSQITVRYS